MPRVASHSVGWVGQCTTLRLDSLRRELPWLRFGKARVVVGPRGLRRLLFPLDSRLEAALRGE